MASDPCREAFDSWNAGVFDEDEAEEIYEIWQIAWNASREELAKEQARDGIRLVKFVDGGTLEPRKFEYEGEPPC